MRRGYTIIELVITLLIIAIVAAISYPVTVSLKRKANRAHCIGNLKQIGIALNIYREQEGGSEFGTPEQMGLPPHLAVLSHDPGVRLLSVSALRCKGHNPDGNPYASLWPVESSPRWYHEMWVELVRAVKESVVVVCDENHQPSFPRSYSWEKWTAIGLQLDGRVRIETKYGFPANSFWWSR